MNGTTMAHDFAVTLQILLSCVTIQTVALVELQGRDLILKRSAEVHFKGLVQASTLLLIPPKLTTMQLAIDLVRLLDFVGILVTAQFFYVTLLLAENTPFDIVALRYRGPSKPPPGYDSFYGKSRGELNYDELVIFDHRAIHPRYIIFCQK